MHHPFLVLPLVLANLGISSQENPILLQSQSSFSEYALVHQKTIKNLKQSLPNEDSISPILNESSHPGGTRGDICAVVPSQIHQNSWDTQPLFVFEDKVEQISIEMRTDAGYVSILDMTSISDTNTSSDFNSYQYTASNLEPGRYRLTLGFMSATGVMDTTSFNFNVIDRMTWADAEALSLALAEVDSQSSPNTVARERADIFADFNLQMDVVREFETLETIPPLWQEDLDIYYNSVCGDEPQ